LFTVGINRFTGDPGLVEGEREEEVINGTHMYVRGPAENQDKHRAGVFYIGFVPVRISQNSEGIRPIFQNRVAHDRLTDSPHFRVLDIPSRWYLYAGTGSGNTR